MDVILYILIGLCFVLPFGINIANDDERFVVIKMGRYSGIKGPGLLFKWPGHLPIWIRIALNDKGQYLGDGFVKVNEAVFPANNTEGLHPGSPITISSFSGGNISVVQG